MLAAVPACGRVGFDAIDAVSSDTQARCDVTFGPAMTYPGGAGPGAVAVGDIDGDLRPDVIVGTQAPNQIAVHRNGNFGLPVTFAVPGPPTAIAVADVNGDGRDDVLVTHGNSGLCVFTNDGAGGLAPCVGRLTGDGPQSLAVGRLDGDLAPDIVVGNQISGSLGVYINDGTGGFSNASNYGSGGTNPVGDIFVDLDRDGAQDLVTVNLLSDNVAVLHGDNSQALGPITTYSTGRTPGWVAAGDLDGDALPDVVVATESSIEVLRGTPNATLLPAISYATGVTLPFPLTRAVVLADFNGDGSLDAASTNRLASTLGVFINQQDGTLARPIDVPVGRDTDRLAAADFDGDGRLDLVVTSSATNELTVVPGSCR